MSQTRAQLLQSAVTRASDQVALVRTQAERAHVEVDGLLAEDRALSAMAARDIRPDVGRGARNTAIKEARRRAIALDGLLRDAELALQRLINNAGYRPHRRRSRKAGK